MIKKLEEAKALIDAGKLEEAKAKIDEVIAAQPAQTAGDDNTEVPLPGGGQTGPIEK